mgnify:CR=1 FL=1
MNRLDLFAIAKETMKFTEDFMKETGCNECAEVEFNLEVVLVTMEKRKLVSLPCISRLNGVQR